MSFDFDFGEAFDQSSPTPVFIESGGVQVISLPHRLRTGESKALKELLDLPSDSVDSVDSVCNALECTNLIGALSIEVARNDAKLPPEHLAVALARLDGGILWLSTLLSHHPERDSNGDLLFDEDGRWDRVLRPLVIRVPEICSTKPWSDELDTQVANLLGTLFRAPYNVGGAAELHVWAQGKSEVSEVAKHASRDLSVQELHTRGKSGAWRAVWVLCAVETCMVLLRCGGAEKVVFRHDTCSVIQEDVVRWVCKVVADVGCPSIAEHNFVGDALRVLRHFDLAHWAAARGGEGHAVWRLTWDSDKFIEVVEQLAAGCQFNASTRNKGDDWSGVAKKLVIAAKTLAEEGLSEKQQQQLGGRHLLPRLIVLRSATAGTAADHGSRVIRRFLPFILHELTKDKSQSFFYRPEELSEQVAKKLLALPEFRAELGEKVTKAVKTLPTLIGNNPHLFHQRLSQIEMRISIPENCCVRRRIVKWWVPAAWLETATFDDVQHALDVHVGDRAVLPKERMMPDDLLGPPGTLWADRVVHQRVEWRVRASARLSGRRHDREEHLCCGAPMVMMLELRTPTKCAGCSVVMEEGTLTAHQQYAWSCCVGECNRCVVACPKCASGSGMAVPARE